MENFDILPHIDDILKEITLCSGTFATNRQYHRVLNDNLKLVLEEDVYSLLKSKSNKKDKINQSISTNFLKKIATKLSQLYTFDVIWKPSSDQEKVDYYIKTMRPKKFLQKGNFYYNGTKSVLMEVWYDKKYRVKVRPISNNKYFLWTSDKSDPTTPQVVVKIIGTFEEPCQETGHPMEKDLYHMWSESHMIICDSQGKIRTELMGDPETDEFFGLNPYKTLPFVHVTQDMENTFPIPDTDTLSTLLQVNDILTDAKVSTYHQSNPMIVATNIDKKKSSFARGPDDITILNPKTPGERPELKVIPSALDTTKAVELAKDVLESMMDSKGLISKEGSATSNKSGLAMRIESSDTTEVRKVQIEDWVPADEEVWEKVAVVHNWLVDNKLALLPRRAPKEKFNEDFYMETEFALPSTLVEESEEINENGGQAEPETEGEVTE